MTSSYSCFAILVLVLIQFTYSRQSIQKSYDSESCLFIGCSCGIDKIKCPASRLDLSFTMFPKRSLYKISSKNITLDLSENSIKLLPDDRFAHLNLFKLNLSANQIDTISTYSFRDIGDLKILDLSNNRLSDLRVETLIYFERKLQTIILEGNYLYRMDRIHLGNAISRLEKLENLNLAFNDLRNLPNLTK
jgi:Leucine-rich repeat (LRR) protein